MTPDGKVSVAEESIARLRSSSQLLEEVILEQDEDNLKPTNIWSNSEKSEEYEFEATQNIENTSEGSSGESRHSINDLCTP